MKKGFTLIEMVGVMVILSLLMLFAMPNIINYIKKGGDAKDTVVKTLVYDAASKYINDNKSVFKQDSKNTYCISLYTLASEGYVESPVVLSGSDEDITSETSTKSVKVTYDKKYKYELTDECTGIVNPTPVLTKGLTPVVYDEEHENWVVVDPKDNNWYNYDEQKWANAVVLGTNVTKQVGDTVAVDGSEAKMMLVWIPRYEYKYTNLAEAYAGGSKEQPGEIEVSFVSKNVKSGSSNEYKVHPAFTFGEQELSGIWVGKFELSHSDQTKSETSINCTTDTCSEAPYLRVLPNKISLRNNAVSSYFYGIRSIENTSLFGLSNMDTHMIKNSEWGAVAYLSQSKYGKYGNTSYEGTNKEIYQNKSSEYIAGSSNGSESIGNSLRRNPQCAYNDMTTLGEKKGVCGPGASTTGNIYGVYDMNGGAYEYMMSAYGSKNNPSIRYSGFYPNDIFTSGKINSKYYETYQYNCENDDICFGHALLETQNWYDDENIFSTQIYPWFVRGGYSENGKISGVFNFRYDNGVANNIISTRVVFISK